MVGFLLLSIDIVYIIIDYQPRFFRNFYVLVRSVGLAFNS